MSIYISNMEMPTKGYRLILVNADGTVQTTSGETTAVPVPPHGRLGDLDAVEAKIREKTNEQFCVNIIHATPTIIPAEEDET